MKHLFYPFLALPVLLAAENLLPDASLELGGADYAKLRYARPMQPEEVKYLPPVPDQNTRVHGRQSLRFDNPDATPAVLRSPDFSVIPGKPYTLSFYAKSSKPVKLRYLPLSIIPAEKNGRAARDWFNPSRTVTLSTDWKRYTYTFLPPNGHKSYLLDFLWGENSDATVWFDALQVEPGTQATPFSLRSDMEFMFTAPRHLHIDGEQPLTFTLTGINYGKDDRTVKFLFRDRDDYTGKALAERPVELTVPPGRTASKTFTVPMRPYSVYSTEAVFTLNGKQERVLPFLYAFSGKYTPEPFHPDRDFVLGVEEGFHFGCPNINGGKTFFQLLESDEADYHRINRNQGYRINRIGNGVYRIFEWATVEPEQGKFDFRLADRLVNQRIGYGNVLLGVLGNVLLERYLPEWAQRRGTLSSTFKMHGKPAIMPNLDDWRNYVRATISHFKGRIRHWEILNEANLTTSPEDYVKLAKIAFEECRKIDPAIRVIAPNVTGDLGGQMGDFLDRFGKLGGYQYTDIVSFHPYSSREEHSPYPAHEAVRDIRRIIAKYRKGLPLWNTELYYTVQRHNADAVTHGTVSAQSFIRRVLLDLGEGVKQETLLPSEKSYRGDRNPGYGYSRERVQRRLIPSDIYVAANAFARMMERAVPAGKLNTPLGTTAYLYTIPGKQPMAAVWNYTPNRKFSITFSNPQAADLFDIFGNPVKAVSSMPLTNTPIYIRGRQGLDALRKMLNESRIVPENGYEITRARWFAEQGKPVLALEFRSTQEAQELKVRMLSAPSAKAAKPGSASLLIPAGKTAVLLIPVETKGSVLPGGTVKLMIYDGKVTRTVSVPVEAQRFLRSGETAQITQVTTGKAENDDSFSASFQASGDSKMFRLNILVHDVKRGKYSPPEFWNGDCIELYFDRAPLADMERKEYRKDTFRLYMTAGAEGKPARLDKSGDVDLSSIRWKLTDTENGYAAVLEIPWRELRQAPGTPVSFDIAVNDNDGKKRRLQKTWSGTRFNHLFRHNFGFWIPE